MSFKEKKGEEGKREKKKDLSPAQNPQNKEMSTMMALYVDYLSLPTTKMKVLLERPVDTLIF